MKIKHIILILILSLIGINGLVAQNTNTMYFMDEIAERNNLNPALTPQCKFYFDFIVLPNFYVGLNTNNLILQDFMYNKDGKTISFLNSQEGKDRLYNKLRPYSTIDADVALNILSFGFAVKKHYFTFDLGLRAEISGYVPKDLFKLAFYGTPDEYGVNSFDFSTLGADVLAYSNVGIGYMYKFNDKWTIGAKAKFLMGYANIDTDIEKLQLNASREKWELHTNANINASLPIRYSRTSDGSIDFNTVSVTGNDIIELLYKPAGYGASFDLGLAYQPIKYLTLSASVTDLGFIHWNRNIIHGNMSGQHQIESIIDYNVGDSISSDQIMDQFTELGNEILGTITVDDEQKGYTSMIRGNFMVAAEYGILKNKISFGLLNRLKFQDKRLQDEVTIAANFRPLNCIKASLNYSFINGRWHNFGAGLNLRAGVVNMYIMADYIPLSYYKINMADNTKQLTLPSRTSNINIQAGMCLNIGNYANDTDRDGVRKRKDKCPNTDMDFLRKQCPGLKLKEYVDKNGCEYDTDKDGIHDCYDRCPDTPFGVLVDEYGCPRDADEDGVPDYMDECPNTPTGIEVDFKGCPYDSDSDGVADYLDQCPDTPAGAEVDENGCPVDSDGDGVPDYMDQCPDTPEGIEVDENGCPFDTDKDGIPDYKDNCPDTPENVEVDLYGCPVDTDKDGVPDYLDKCPLQAGPASNHGCPELKKEVRNLFKKAMTGIKFETGKDIIKKSSYPIIDQIAAVMELNTNYKLVIKGYTDNVGNDQKNLELSKSRANSVMLYLINKGIDPSRLKSEGYGEENPIADNKTSKGRSLNRRVEFEIVYETISYEKIENPELKATTENKTDTIQ